MCWEEDFPGSCRRWSSNPQYRCGRWKNHPNSKSWIVFFRHVELRRGGDFWSWSGVHRFEIVSWHLVRENKANRDTLKIFLTVLLRTKSCDCAVSLKRWQVSFCQTCIFLPWMVYGTVYDTYQTAFMNLCRTSNEGIQIIEPQLLVKWGFKVGPA